MLELGKLIAGPFARILAEFGAEVIKIEPPASGGDPLRQWRKLHEGTSLWWYVQARNKKSVTRRTCGSRKAQEIVRRLARDADIVIENFRPGALEKWGLGYDALVAAQPGPDHGAPVGLRPDRPVSRPAGLRRHRRGDGRHALRHRLSRPAAGARRHQHRRLASRRCTA